MAPSGSAAAVLFRLSSAVDEQSMLQMAALVEQKLAVDSDSGCACPGYFRSQCLDNAFQGCVWEAGGPDSDEGWCQCDPDFVGTPPLFAAPAAEQPAPPAGYWVMHSDTNVFPTHGAEALWRDGADYIDDLTLERCKAECVFFDGCDTITFAREDSHSPGRCHFRRILDYADARTGEGVWDSWTWHASRDRLLLGENLGPDEKLDSPDGTARLKMQVDGNLVVQTRDASGWKYPEWHSLSVSGTMNPGSRLYMQGDGNLVLYARTYVQGDPAIWNSATHSTEAVMVRLYDDCRVEISDQAGAVLWSLGTCCSVTCGVLEQGESLNPGDFLDSPGGTARLGMQHDGNLVLRHPPENPTPVWALAHWSGASLLAIGSDSSNLPEMPAGFVIPPNEIPLDYDEHITRAVNNGHLSAADAALMRWHIWTALWAYKRGEEVELRLYDLLPEARLRMKGDGDLVLFADETFEYPIWSSRTQGHGPVKTKLTDDCRVLIVNQAGDILWELGTSC